MLISVMTAAEGGGLTRISQCRFVSELLLFMATTERFKCASIEDKFALQERPRLPFICRPSSSMASLSGMTTRLMWWQDTDNCPVCLDMWWQDTDNCPVCLDMWWQDTNNCPVCLDMWWQDTDNCPVCLDMWWQDTDNCPVCLDMWWQDTDNCPVCLDMW